MYETYVLKKALNCYNSITLNSLCNVTSYYIMYYKVYSSFTVPIYEKTKRKMKMFIKLLSDIYKL